MLKTINVHTAIAVVLAGLAMPTHAIADTPKPVHIPAGDLRQALLQASEQFGVDLVYSPEQLRDLNTHGAYGRLTSEQAITRLLEGTPLEVRIDQGGAMLIAAAPAAAKEVPGPAADASVELEEIVVTGSRLLRRTSEGPQELHIYEKEQIEKSGRTTVADFLNTLPMVSAGIQENAVQTVGGATTVQLRGLPAGKTLVLINGRRVHTSGSQARADFFDLNSIPMAAIERIEVLASGSSAVYGSDAIAGSVNFILKKDIDGLQLNAKSGRADDLSTTTVDASWGAQWSKGSLSIVATYESRGELSLSDRALTSSNDYTAYGGPDNNFPACNPGNVFSLDESTPLPGLGSATFAAVPAGLTGTANVADFQATAGTLNTCNWITGSSLIPENRRAGLLLTGSYELTPSIELFTEILYSNVKQYALAFGHPSLFGFAFPGFQDYTVSASNPYNPFGTTVGIAYMFTSLPVGGQIFDTDFVRPLMGMRGDLSAQWQWELAAYQSADFTENTLRMQVFDPAAIQAALNSSDPATAFNPFVAGAPSVQQQQLIQSFYSDGVQTYIGRTTALQGFVRGPALTLPGGPVEVVVGAEYDRNSLHSNNTSNPFAALGISTLRRRSHAVFAEARVPIVGGPAEGGSEILAATVAGRYDHYSDFGAETTPQFGLEWRPSASLLFRGTYGEAFKAPSLSRLFSPRFTSPINVVTDPTTGLPTSVAVVSGGNPDLQPETGESHTFGFVYSSQALPGLQLSATHWRVKEDLAISTLSAQTIVNNENIFPERVTRASTGTITQVDASAINFGEFAVEGIDYQISYRLQTPFGTWRPSLSATQTSDYTVALLPGVAATSRLSKANDDSAWAPRWKGTAALGWEYDPYSANIGCRYIGRYQDYGSTREIGKFWLCDADIRVALGRAIGTDSSRLQDLSLQLGGVNIFDNLPQYSNYGASFFGYDPTQADILGRFLYAKVSVKW